MTTCSKTNNMNDLLEALHMIDLASDGKATTACEHDVLIIHGADEDDFSPGELVRLVELGFEWNDTYGFCSYLYGS